MKFASTLLTLALCATALPAQNATMTNDDVVKLSKAGLSDALVAEMIDKQGGHLSSDITSLIQMKDGGVPERIISAVVKKSPAVEPLNTDSVLRLVDAKFSDGFIVDLINARSGHFSTDAAGVIELKRAGVSDRLLSMMVSQGSSRELPRGTEISVRLVDGIDSEVNTVGDQFMASLDDPIVIGNDVIAKKGAKATVKLVDAKDSGKLTGRTALTLQLTSVVIDGKTVNLASSDLSELSGSRGERTAKSAAAVGVLGAIIGGIAGGGKGAAIGAAAGAGAGAGSQVLFDPQKVKVPSETVLKFVTSEPAKI